MAATDFTQWNTAWVADSTILHARLAAWEGQPTVALDTEFIRERTFWAQLALVQLAVFCLDHAMDLHTALGLPRVDASAPRIVVDRDTPDGTLSAIRVTHDADAVENLLYPVQFAIPSAVSITAQGEMTGMVHPNHPWSAALRAEDAA